MYQCWAVSMPLCIRPAHVGCLQKSLVAKEVSQHRHRCFRLVIASLQSGPTAQRRAQLKHLETTLRTPPAHAHTGCGGPTKTSYEAPERDITSDRREVCVCVSVLGCVYASVYPSCARWLLAKKFGCKRVFAASSSLFSPCDCLPPVWTNGTKKSTAKTFRNDALDSPRPHTHRLRAEPQRLATRRQQETTQATDARCVCIRPGLCL